MDELSRLDAEVSLARVRVGEMGIASEDWALGVGSVIEKLIRERDEAGVEGRGLELDRVSLSEDCLDFALSPVFASSFGV